MQKKAVAVQTIDNERENENIEQRRRFLDKREADFAVKEADSMSRQDKRSKELDERECDITQSENRVKKTLAAAEAKKNGCGKKNGIGRSYV